MDSTVKAQVLRAMAAQVQTTAFSDLAQLEGEYYFDANGSPQTNRDNAQFNMVLSLGTTQFPGSENSRAALGALHANVTMQISSIRDSRESVVQNLRIANRSGNRANSQP